MNVYDKAGQYGLYGLLEGSDRQGNGESWFVDSNSGNKANTAGTGQGASWDLPFSTINYAVSRCSNGGQDVILVAAGHAETIEDTSPLNQSGTVTDELCVDKSGVSIIGMGTGTTRPTLTLDTNTDATLEIRAADVTIKNLILISDVVDCAAAINISNGNDGVLIENCEIRDGGTAVLELVLGISISENADDTTIRGCTFITTAAGSGTLSAIYTASTAKRLRIYDNVFMGDWNSQVMDLDDDKITDLYVVNNIINSLDSAGVAIDTAATSTGVISGNTIHTGSEANAIIAAACLVGPNYITNTEGDLGGLSKSNEGGVITATKTYTNFTAAKHTLFNIVGPIRVNYLVGVVMATIKAASIDINLDATTTDPGGDLALATLLAIDADAVGTLYTINGTFGGALVATTVGAVADTTEGFFMNTGAITMESTDAAEDGGGSIQWSISYTPLAPGSYVVPAPTD